MTEKESKKIHSVLQNMVNADSIGEKKRSVKNNTGDYFKMFDRFSRLTTDPDKFLIYFLSLFLTNVYFFQFVYCFNISNPGKYLKRLKIFNLSLLKKKIWERKLFLKIYILINTIF